jgi:predicted nucleic acid-binding Zn ribbon protein
LLSKGQGLLERLREGAARALTVLDAVRAELPEEPAGHVLAAWVKEGTLTVLVDSAAWATRIRYESPGLSGPVGKRLGVDIARTVVRVRPGRT